jgi:hypothetical protein
MAARNSWQAIDPGGFVSNHELHATSGADLAI